jgi:hypothetical protein
MGDLIDTLFNLAIFVYVGLLLWLLFKKDGSPKKE